MPDPGRIYQVAEKHRRELLQNERAAASAMVREYGAAWQRVRTQLDALTGQIADARKAGEKVEASWLFRQNRLQALLDQVQTEIARFVDYAAPEITRQQRDAVEAAQRHTQAEVAAISDDMTTLASFNRLPSEAITDLVGCTETGPLRELLDKLGPDVSQGFREAMIESVAIGRNPRETARRVRKEFSVGLSQALRISRTEQLRSYRTATLRNYQANSDIIDGWIWLAAKQGRTCPMCLAMDGTEHSLNETLNDHPQGRCKPIPKVKGHKLPARETGAEWLEKQDEATQRKVLGNAGYEAFKAGQVTLKDFVGQKRSKDWGTTRYAKSLTQILGKEEAAKFRVVSPKSFFVPKFATAREAEQWAAKNYVDSFEISGLSAAKMNSINRAAGLVLIPNGVRVNKIALLESGSRTYGRCLVYLDGTTEVFLQREFLTRPSQQCAKDIIRFNKIKAQNIAKFERDLVDPKKQGSKLKNAAWLEFWRQCPRWSVIDDADDRILAAAAHEFGHALTRTSQIKWAWGNALFRHGVQGSGFISMYASTNNQELLAEVTAAIASGRRHIVPDNILKAYDEIIELVRKETS